MKKIFIASDHRGFYKKAELSDMLRENQYEVNDLGPLVYNPSDDFNDGAITVAKSVLAEPDSIGILLCGSAAGICMQANRFKGIRAVACYNKDIAEISRKHNDANIICLPADFLSAPEMFDIFKVFISTSFEQDERFIRRNQRLDEEQQ